MEGGQRYGTRVGHGTSVGGLVWAVISVLLWVVDGHHPHEQFHSHSIVHPVLYHGRHRREVKTTEDSTAEGFHIHDLTVAFDVNGTDYVLDLQLNRNLIPNNYFQKYHHKGKSVVNRPNKHEIELCHYNGKLRGKAGSWAAISTCDGIHGVIFDGEELHHIQKLGPSDLGSNPHVVYKHEHLKETNHTCGYEGTGGFHSEQSEQEPEESFFKDETYNRILRYKRDISVSKSEPVQNSKIDVKGPWNSNKRSRYVELVLVVDQRQYKNYGSDLDKVYRKCKDIANIVNALYAPLNIYIALVGVVVWTEYDEITLSTNGDTTLTNFLHYRRERLVKDHPNDNAQLLTGIHFDSGVVGKALKGPICTYEFSGGVNMWHSDVVGLVATTLAHEMGHNFGMEHDTENCKCPDDRCIMAPASSTMKPSFWSSCSLEYLALAFEHGMDYCLRNKPDTLFDSPVCGNGFVEPGEQCDCGLKEHCDNPCCNPDTCKLFKNATCATGECCDFNTCQPKLPGSICRLSEHECDLPEYCTGESEFCPSDIFKVDGIPCKVGKAYCYQGSCRTHSDQCKLLWGSTGKKSDNQCFEQNRKGSRHGNCGYNRVNKSYIPCVNDDVRCGMLHCSHLNERLEFGMESVAILSHSFINSGGRIIPCRTALVDLGVNDKDPGLAPEGSRCSDDHLCVNQKCMPIGSLKIGPMSCPNNCNGNGVCNSLGTCHCDVGWAPPFCVSPGPGGSEESGPASNSNGQSGWSTVLYIFFLGILPFILVVMLLIYYIRGDLQVMLKKNQPTRFIPGTERRKSKTDSNLYSRPPSRLNIDAKDISGPMSMDTNLSTSSSPTHALLPRSSTIVSEIGSSGGPRDSTPEPVISSLLCNNVVGYARRKSQESKSQALESPPETHGEDVKAKETTGSSSRASNFMKKFNKSISFPSSFPSPKFRSALKANPDNSKYEVKIEPRQQDGSSSADSLDNIGSIPETTSNQSLVGTRVMSNASTPTASSPMQTFSTFFQGKDSNASKASSPVEKVETCVVLESKNRDAPAPSQILLDFKNNPKLAFPHSSSFNTYNMNKGDALIQGSQSSSSLISPTSFGRKSATLPVMPSVNEVHKKPSNPESYINRNATAGQRNITSPFMSNVQPLQSPFLQKSGSKSPTAPATATPVSTATVQPFTSVPTVPSVKSPTTAVSDSQKTKEQSPTAIDKDKKLLSPTFTEIEKTKNKLFSQANKSKGLSPIVSIMDKKPNKEKSPTPISPISPIVSVMDKKLLNKEKSPSPISPTTTSPTATKPSSPPTTTTTSPTTAPPVPVTTTPPPIPAKPELISAPIAPFQKTSKTSAPTATVRPLISKPIFQNATPNATSVIAKAPSTGISQSSILATNKEKEQDPFKPPKEKGRRAVFCDPITLPSPTSPNNPPIIHQQMGSGPNESGQVITPTWSTKAVPMSSQAQLCNLDDNSSTSSNDDSKKESITETDSASAVAEKPGKPEKTKSRLSKFSIKRTPSLAEPDGRPDHKDKETKSSKYSSLPRNASNKADKLKKSNLRSLDISSPVLQSDIDHKSELLPVCRSPDTIMSDQYVTTTAPSTVPRGNLEINSEQSSPTTKRVAPKPPIKPGEAIPSIPSSPQAISSSALPEIKTTINPAMNDEIRLSPEKTKSKSIWRPGKFKNRGSERRDSAPISEAMVPKVSSNDDIKKYEKPELTTMGSMRQRRPASIATSKPIRPTAAPPKPPPSRNTSKETSPEEIYIYDDATAVGGRNTAPLSNISESSSPEPIYSTIKEGGIGEYTSVPSSPILSKKSPDTISTGSSAEEDLMKSILKEMDNKTEGESIYSSLMRKDKRQRKKN